MLRRRALIVAFWPLCACAPQTPAQPAPLPETTSVSTASVDAGVVKLTVLGLNDLHGKLGALPLFAGFAKHLRAERERDHGELLLVDAGDMFQGTLESNLTEGASVVRAYNAFGMQAAALGNHEFDFGPEGSLPANANGDPQGALKARLSEAKFPMLSANLVDRFGKQPAWQNLQASARRVAAGVQVGFIGVVTRRTPKIVTRAFFAGLDVTALAPAIARESKKLRAAGASVVIVLAHEGADCSKFDDPMDLSSCSEQEIFDVARKLPQGSADVIVAGHSHAGVAHYVNGIAIVEAYSKGKAFSRVDIRIDAQTKRVLGTEIFPPEPLCPSDPCPTQAMYAGKPISSDPAISTVIAGALALAERRRNESLGVILEDSLPAIGTAESALGNLFADLMLESIPGSDFALGNGGSLRAALPRGELRYGKLFEAMPFDNYLASIEITGAELRRVLTEHLQAEGRSLISVAGISVDASCRAGQLQLTIKKANGKLVNHNDTLRLATSDYLATGGDGLLEPANLHETRIKVDMSTLVREAFASALRKRKTISARDLLDPKHPRLRLVSAKPVRCPND